MLRAQWAFVYGRSLFVFPVLRALRGGWGGVGGGGVPPQPKCVALPPPFFLRVVLAGALRAGGTRGVKARL
jgi:hypothetical protein